MSVNMEAILNNNQLEQPLSLGVKCLSRRAVPDQNLPIFPLTDWPLTLIICVHLNISDGCLGWIPSMGLLFQTWEVLLSFVTSQGADFLGIVCHTHFQLPAVIDASSFCRFS